MKNGWFVKNHVLACGLISIGSASSAADWKLVTTSSTNSDWYIDQSSNTGTGQYRYAWFKEDAKNNKTKKISESKQWEAFDCINKSSSTATVIEYNHDGSVSYSRDFPDWASSFQAIVPDTIGETWYNSVCNK